MTPRQVFSAIYVIAADLSGGRAELERILEETVREELFRERDQEELERRNAEAVRQLTRFTGFAAQKREA